jgi:hypothetical protein
MDCFQGARFTIRFLLIFVQEEEEEEEVEEGRFFTKKNFNLENFVLFLLKKKKRITDQEKRIYRSPLNSRHGTIFSVQISNFGIPIP